MEVNGIRLPGIEENTPDIFHQMVAGLPRKQRARIMRREAFIKEAQEIENGHGNSL